MTSATMDSDDDGVTIAFVPTGGRGLLVESPGRATDAGRPVLRVGSSVGGRVMDAYQTISRDIRVARAAQADPAFWADYHRRRAMNHVALSLLLRDALPDVDVERAGLRQRIAGALAEYEAIQLALRERVDGGAK